MAYNNWIQISLSMFKYLNKTNIDASILDNLPLSIKI